MYYIIYVFIYSVLLSGLFITINCISAFSYFTIGNKNNIQTEEKSGYHLNLWSFFKGNSVLM